MHDTKSDTMRLSRQPWVSGEVFIQSEPDQPFRPFLRPNTQSYGRDWAPYPPVSLLCA